jgi:hypothetical protein
LVYNQDKHNQYEALTDCLTTLYQLQIADDIRNDWTAEAIEKLMAEL